MNETTVTTVYKAEKLSLWDRLFNRYKTIPVEILSERWWSATQYQMIADRKDYYSRDCVIYHKVDRLTGSYTIVKKYLN